MQKGLRVKLLLAGIFLLSFAYGYYTTLARISSSSAEVTSKVALAELASSAPALLWGMLSDKLGAKRVSPLGLIAAPIALSGTSPLSVFLALSFFYAPFLVALLEASTISNEVLGEAVAFLSLGWGLGVLALSLEVIGKTLLALSFILGSILVTLGSENRVSSFEPVKALVKLKPLILPLSLFIGAEYLAYALTALRLYEVAPSLFALSYAILPSITSFICGYCAGKAVEAYGAERVLLASMASYPLVVFLALVAPPPLCLISWAIPIYPFYETSLISLVIRVANVSEGSALGFTYALMAISSLMVFPLTSINNITIHAIVIIAMMVMANILMWRSLKRLTPS